MLDIFTTINTCIVCVTVLYCVREILTRVDTLVMKQDVQEEIAITDVDVEQAYEDARKANELPADFANVVQELMQGLELDE